MEQIKKERNKTTAPTEGAGGDLVPVPKTSTIRTRNISSTGAGVMPMEQGEFASGMIKLSKQERKIK